MQFLRSVCVHAELQRQDLRRQWLWWQLRNMLQQFNVQRVRSVCVHTCLQWQDLRRQRLWWQLWHLFLGQVLCERELRRGSQRMRSCDQRGLRSV